jgi:6-phosphogluconate dehydrogenase
MKEERVKASKLLTGPEAKPAAENKEELIEAVRKALFMSKICSYAQGFAQMKAASEEYGWDLKYGDIANDLPRRMHHPRGVPAKNQRSV